MNTIDYIYRDLKEILDTVVVKYDRKAKDAETVESRRESDKYINAKLELDTFRSHAKFSKDAIRNCGVFNEETVELYHSDKNLIPESMRDRVVKEERFLILENYEEKNNYYRELIGLPNTDDFDFIYLPIDVCRKYNLSSRLAIHEYRVDEIYKIERTVLPELIEQYPDKGYLKYLGSNKVDLVEARRANNFEIIRSSLSQDVVFLNKFFEAYMSCREYFTSVIYIKEFSSRYDLYDNFIAMNIMLMCIQRLMVNTIQIGVHRDFYDLHSIQSLFNSYGLPFFEDLPLDYQRSIMKNLNMLLRYKSTDKVLYDISNILFFDRIKIFKYFLIKDRNFDKKGNPIFAYKEVENEFGEIEIVEDVEKMYSFYFQSTDVLERNTALALENSQHKLSYEEVTENDMFWWSDEDVQKVLYEQEYNYVESKYLSVTVMYRITETMFESIYALNMLADKKESSTNSIYITLPRITSEKVSVFDAVIMLFALTSKKCGMKGNIISQPTQILSVLGFNFKANFDAIIEQVYANKSNLPDEIVKYLINLDITSAKDINDMYYNIRWLADFLTERINTTTSLKEYRACSDLYKTLMIKDYTTDILKKRDGSVASTYTDYLLDQNPKLGKFVESCTKNNVDVYIKHILGKINELIPELEHMSTLEGSDGILINALMKLIEFFKSYTVDLESLNVLYVMDSKYYNMIRMVHDIKHIEKIIQNNEHSFREYFDTIATHVKLDGKDQLEYLHRCFVNKVALFKYLREILDTEYINKTLGLTSNIPNLTDEDRAEISKIIESFDDTYLDYTQEYHINIDVKNKYTMKEIIREIVTKILIKDSSTMNLYNDTLEIICKDNYRFNINIDEFVAFFAKLYIDIYLTLDEKYTLASIVDAKDFMMEDYIDILHADSSIEPSTDVVTYDKGIPMVTISREDKWFDKLKTKLQNYEVLARIKCLLQSTNIIQAFNSISTQYNISPEEWFDISNKFDVIERGYKNIEYWYDSKMSAKMVLLEDYFDIIDQIKMISIATKVKASELCKVYIALTRIDKLPLEYRHKYKAISVVRNTVKAINKPFVEKITNGSFVVNTRELYKVYRSIHRDDKVSIRELYGLDVDITCKVNTLTNFKAFVEKTTQMKMKHIISDYMKVYLQHNLQSLLKLEHDIRANKNVKISSKILDVYKGFLLSIISFIDIPSDNIPLKDENPVTIIRHNFEEINKINFKMIKYTSDTLLWETIFESYYQTLNHIDKLLNISDHGNIRCDEVCRHVEMLIDHYLDSINDIIQHASANISYNENDLKNIREFLHIFGNIYTKDRAKLLSKIQMIHVNIDIAYLMLNRDEINHIDVIASFNDTSISLLFNSLLIRDLISVAEKFGLVHEVSAMYKDFYNEFYISVKEDHALSNIIQINKTLSMIYSEYIYTKKGLQYKDKTNMEDRIKVFYE